MPAWVAPAVMGGAGLLSGKQSAKNASQPTTSQNAPPSQLGGWGSLQTVLAPLLQGYQGWQSPYAQAAGLGQPGPAGGIGQPSPFSEGGMIGEIDQSQILDRLQAPGVNDGGASVSHGISPNFGGPEGMPNPYQAPAGAQPRQANYGGGSGQELGEALKQLMLLGGKGGFGGGR